MTRVSRTTVSLRLIGEDLDPAEITDLLRSPPSLAHRRGEPMQKGGGVWPRGLWLKQAEEQEPGNLDMQIASLLDSINVQNEVWTDLARRFRVDVFCGLFIAEANEGISLSAETLRRLADRSLTIDFDIYANARDPNDD